jgi:hypothetical protein
VPTLVTWCSTPLAMATITSPLWMTEQELKMGLSVMGGSAKPAVKIHAIMLGFGCAVDEEGQLVVSRVLQESPAAYSGQVGIGDVIEAIDGRMVTTLEQLVVAADGPVWILFLTLPPVPFFHLNKNICVHNSYLLTCCNFVQLLVGGNVSCAGDTKKRRLAF